MKKITSVLLFCLLAITSHGQVQIGTGTTTSQGFPIDPYYYYSYSQSIYLASEINAAGAITSIQWYYSGTSNLTNSQDLTIYLGHTSKAAFASGTDWEPVENLTAVYIGNINVEGPGWVTFELEEPFVYNGTDNLIVAATELQEDYDEDEDAFYNTAVTTNRSLGYVSDDEVPNLEDPGDASYFEMFVPTIIFGGLTQACPTPMNVVATTATTTTATLTWQNPDEATYELAHYYVATASTPPNAETAPSGNVTDGMPTVTITEGLLPSTTYYFWVRNVCGDTPGGWSMATSFTTACNAVNTFYEDFDTTEYDELPTCWSAILRGEGISEYAFIATVDYNALSGDNSVEIGNDESAATAEFILVSPNLGNLGAGTHRLKFSAMGYGPLQVGTLSSATEAAVYTNFENIDITEEYTEFVVDFTTYEGEDTYIGFRLNPSDTYESVNLDNIRWEPSPACADVTSFLFSGATTDSANFSWEPGGAESQWDIVVGPSSTIDPDDLIPFSPAPTDPSAVIVNGLAPNTSYKAWVRSVCGNDQDGAWIGPIVFTTACNPAATFSEDFDSTEEGFLPNCWSSIKRGTGLSNFATIENSDSESVSGDFSVRIYTSTTNTNTSDLILVAPILSNAGAGTQQLTFSAMVDIDESEAAALEIVSLSDNTPEAEFTVLETVDLTGDFEAHTIDFSAYTGTDAYIGFRLTTTSTYTYAYIDDISWEPLLSTGQSENATFRFYPNPVKDVLNLSYAQNIAEVAVYNLLGQKVLENVINATSTQLDMSALASGSYLVKVTANNQTKTIKVIKE